MNPHYISIPGIDGNVIYTVGEDGALLKNGAPVFSKGFYKNKTSKLQKGDFS
jgi:hypothetical protein